MGDLLAIVKSITTYFYSDVGQVDVSQAKGGSADESFLEIFNTYISFDVVYLWNLETLVD